MHERGKWHTLKNTLRGIGVGIGVGSVSGILAAGMAPDLLPPPAKRVIFIPPPPILIDYGYDPLNCPKDKEVYKDENIILQQGQPVVIGGVQVESNFGRIDALTTKFQKISGEEHTIRAGNNGEERTYNVQIGQRVILDENNPLGNIDDPIAYKASITGYCGYTKPYGPYVSDLS